MHYLLAKLKNRGGLEGFVSRSPLTKPDVCVNGFPIFKTQISCLQYEASFLSTSKTKYCASLATRKYFFTSFHFDTWLSNLHV